MALLLEQLPLVDAVYPSTPANAPLASGLHKLPLLKIISRPIPNVAVGLNTEQSPYAYSVSGSKTSSMQVV